jgi:hypothetical protein
MLSASVRRLEAKDREPAPRRPVSSSMARKTNDLCDKPLEAQVHRRAVVLTGPDGVALAMTPEAAARSAEILAEAAKRAGHGR